MKPIVEVEHLSKLYRLGSIGATSLRESLGQLFSRASRDGTPATSLKEVLVDEARRGPDPDTFWALKDVSFSVMPGEIVGIVGRNGAGKSTLLKILSRITEPTSGRAVLRGRVVSLLEVGTGFHPELTGRENVFLNGAILGMKRAEISAKFDEIVQFAEIGAFIDTPVKRYSSGMHVRLAFAVAAHLEPEILLIDEVLAVGDAGFQKKCLGKMGEVATQHGRTVFFVSHNMGAIRALCERAFLIDSARITMNGKPSDVISHYLASGMPRDNAIEGQIYWNGHGESPPGADEICLRAIRLTGTDGQPRANFEASEPVIVEISYEVKRQLRGVRFHLSLRTQEGELAFMATDHLFQKEVQGRGFYKTICTIPGGLLNRRQYIIGVGCGVPGERWLIPDGEYLSFTVVGAGNQASNFPEPWPGTLCPRVPWEVREWRPS